MHLVIFVINFVKLLFKNSVFSGGHIMKMLVQLSEILFAQVIPVKLIGWIKESDCLSQWFCCCNPRWAV